MKNEPNEPQACRPVYTVGDRIKNATWGLGGAVCGATGMPYIEPVVAPLWPMAIDMVRKAAELFVHFVL